MNSIETLKSAPYPACMDLILRVRDDIRRVAAVKIEPKTWGAIGAIGKRYDSTINDYRHFVNILDAEVAPQAAPVVAVMNNNNSETIAIYRSKLS